MRRSMILLTWVLVALPPAGCGGNDAGIMDEGTFIDVMIALRREVVVTPDSQAFDARRDAILAEAGVTDSALYAFVRALRGDPDRMASIWDAIDKGINQPSEQGADTANVR